MTDRCLAGMRRRARVAVALTGLLYAQVFYAQSPPQRNTAATVAVLYFTNSSLVHPADYQPLSKGIAEMLITELVANPALQVVEREQLQQVLEEQDLAKSGRVDPETAARLGKILGARYMLTGGFVIDRKSRMRLDLRAVNVETSRIEHVETVSGKADDVLELIASLARKVNAGLRLAPLPPKEHAAKTQASKADQFRAVMSLSRALEREDRGDTPGAIALYREALGLYPEYQRARVLLASLETPKQSR